MLLGNQNRTNNFFIRKEFKNLDWKIIIFLSVLFINFLKFNNEPILFVTPFLVLGYLLGFSYLIIVIMATFIASVIYSPLTFYLSCLFIVVFLIFTILLRITKLKVFLRMLIGSYLSDLLARYIFEFGIYNKITLLPLLYSVIALLLTYVIFKISEHLLNEEKKQYPYQVALGILVILSISLMGLDYSIKNVSILFILLTIFFLFSSKILDFSIYCTFLFINLIILLVLNIFNEYYLFCLFIPCLLVNLTNNKYFRLLIYLISSLLINMYFTTNFNYGLLVSYSIIILIYLITPSSFLSHIKDLICNPNNNLLIYEKKYQKQEKEIQLELNKISEFFSLIVEEYGKDNKDRLNRKKEDVIFQSLCVNCHKNKICYHKNKTLKNLIMKSIESELNEQEINYVNKECLKPSMFFEISELYKKDYFKEYKYYLEYNGLKDALKSQMKGLGLVLDGYAEKLKIDNSIEINYENEIIKDLLDKNQIDYLYVYFYEDIKKNVNINLCVKVNDHQLIYKIKDLISNEFNINLELGKVSEYSLEGFLKIEFKEIKEFKFLHGIYQVNLKEDGNGDSYLVYENSNYIIYCLSDGMGSGKLAREESRFTLKVLKSVLDTGMDLKNGISLMNSLLKIKNRYETYATLDLVSINKKNLKSHFFKNGAVHSYIYSSLENRLIRINSSSLPIGIVDNISSRDYSYRLRANDFILMFSDGIKEDEESLEAYFKQVKEYNPQIIAREINMKFRNKEDLDDTSVLIIKIEK